MSDTEMVQRKNKVGKALPSLETKLEEVKKEANQFILEQEFSR